MTRQLSSQIMFFFTFTSGERWGGAYGKMERPRFTVLHPEGSFNASKDIIERLLLDNMQDEVFILLRTRGLDEETRREVRRALDNMMRRSRHIAVHLVDTLRVRQTRQPAGDNGKVISPCAPRASPDLTLD